MMYFNDLELETRRIGQISRLKEKFILYKIFIQINQIIIIYYLLYFPINQQDNKIKMQQEPSEFKNFKNAFPSLSVLDSLINNIHEPDPFHFQSQSPLILTRHKLYLQYSSSQHYFYTTKITQIVKEKSTTANILFQDIQCLIDEEEYLKREYKQAEYHRKLSSFRQYYFYHEDCPRIYGQSSVAQVYQKWHQKKRDHIYKKLKLLYNETYSSANSSDNTIDEVGPGVEHVTHFLNEISEYNPYSKKYYLRVQARLEKQRQKERQKEIQRQKEKEKEIQKQRLKLEQQNNSFQLYKNYNRQLSRMVAKLKDLSILEFSKIFDSRLNKNDSKNSKLRQGQNYSLDVDLKLNRNLSKLPTTNYKSIDNIIRDKNAAYRISSNLCKNNRPAKIENKEDYVYIQETEGQENNKQRKGAHKKYTSQFNNNSKAQNYHIIKDKQRLFNYNFGSAGFADLLYKNPTKNSVLASSLGRNYQLPTEKTSKINFIKFTEKQLHQFNQPINFHKNTTINIPQQSTKVGTAAIPDQRQKLIKLDKINKVVPSIEHSKQDQKGVKSYKSLQRFNTFNNKITNPSQMEGNKIQRVGQQKIKYSSSTSKLNLAPKTRQKQYQQRQVYNIELLNILDKKLTEKHQEEFTDKKLISYKSQHIQLTPNISTQKTNQMNLKNNYRVQIKFPPPEQKLTQTNKYRSQRKTQKKEVKKDVARWTDRKPNQNSSPEQKTHRNIRINLKHSQPNTNSLSKNLLFKK